MSIQKQGHTIRPKVVLIEDDVAISDMYVKRFAFSGKLEVYVAHNGVAGLELIDKVKPEIILLDMMMPTMSGLETLTRLRKQANGTDYKVIALTNMNDQDIVRKIQDLGVQDYLVKASTPIAEIEQKILELL